MPKNQLDLQLMETGQISGASWAVWLEQTNTWELLAAYNLKFKHRERLLNYIQQSTVKNWLNGGLASKRRRSRNIIPDTGIPGQKMHFFPNMVSKRGILVGADQLSDLAQRFWRVLSLGNSGQIVYEPSTTNAPKKLENMHYQLPLDLDKILRILLQQIECQGGWLAVRSGEYLEVASISNCVECQGIRLSIDSNPLLRELIQSRQPRMVYKDDAEWVMTPRLGFKSSTKVWTALPLVFEKRLIGLVALWGRSSLPPLEWEKLKQLAEELAPSVEGSIAFSELANQLHRMALLNEFAVTISSSIDMEQIIKRTFAFLQRAFSTERINLMILTSDTGEVQNFDNHDGVIVDKLLSAAKFPSTIKKGKVYRDDLISTESVYEPLYSGSKSIIVIPLKFRKQIIGALRLENVKEGAFTLYDEHLLVVIASNLAGLLENGRLRREAESRALNLSLIQDVIEHVIGLTDVQQVSRIAADLMGRNFEYEFAGVALAEGPKNKLHIAGIGGKISAFIKHGQAEKLIAREDGIIASVMATGLSMINNDMAGLARNFQIPDWDSKSAMCVALRDGDLVLGIIDVESNRKNAFSQNDLLILEILAGILASVISNAGQYQRLQTMVDQLRAAREELQERIAAQHVTENRLVQAAKMAAVGEMAAGIAHELNNPLTTISGFTELSLEDLPSESAVHADLELVLREAHRARDVVRQLLEFSRQSESVRSRHDMNEIISDVLALVNHLIHTSGVQIYTNFSEDLPRVSVDRNQVKQVVLNLIHNALNAMPDGGELRITTARCVRKDHEWMKISIADTGSGIPPEHLDRIFEPFFTTRAKKGGTGLGLSVSYGIITEHGGFIEPESQVGKGSIFTIWLPIEEN